jgi:thioredoxin reductase
VEEGDKAADRHLLRGHEPRQLDLHKASSSTIPDPATHFVTEPLNTRAFLFPARVARDEHGFVVTDASFETASPGVFAIGAVRSGYGGRLTQAVAEATTAAERAAARCED